MSAPQDPTQAQAIRRGTAMVVVAYAVAGVGLALGHWSAAAGTADPLNPALSAGQAAGVLGLLATLTIAVFVALVSSLDGQGNAVGSERHQLTFVTVLTALILLTAAAGTAPVISDLVRGPAMALNSLLTLGASIVLAYIAALAWSAVPARISIEHMARVEAHRSAQVSLSLERLGEYRARWTSIAAWSAAIFIVPPGLLAAPFIESRDELLPLVGLFATFSAPPTVGVLLLVVAVARSSWSVVATLTILLLLWGLTSVVGLAGTGRGRNDLLILGSWMAATVSWFVLAFLGSRRQRGFQDVVRVALLVSERIASGGDGVNMVGSRLSRPWRRAATELLWLLGRTSHGEAERPEDTTENEPPG